MTETSKVPDELLVDHLVEAGFESLCTRYRELTDLETEIGVEKKELSAVIKPLMQAAGARSVVGPGWNAIRAKGTTVQIVKTRLLEYGVSLKVIEASTKRTPYEYIQVRRVGREL